MAADDAAHARAEGEDQEQRDRVAAAVAAARTFTLDPPPVGWKWGAQPQMLRLNADGATTADKALTKVLKERQSGLGAPPEG